MKKDLCAILEEVSYPGRGIMLGRTESGDKAVIVYFIMGRSENSRNRIFTETEDGIRTEAFDPSKMSDPSLIIYRPVRKIGDHTIVTNGDQTDTVVEGYLAGKGFSESLTTRQFEPDAPNYTPRISGDLFVKDGAMSYELSILKSADGDPSSCERFTYSYETPIAGQGHFISTYEGDGNPLPSFAKEPVRVCVPDDVKEFGDSIWESLNKDNKVSLFVRSTDLADGSAQSWIYNKNE